MVQFVQLATKYFSKTPCLDNLVPLKGDIRWDKNIHMNTEIIHPTKTGSYEQARKPNVYDR